MPQFLAPIASDSSNESFLHGNNVQHQQRLNGLQIAPKKVAS